LEIYLLYYSSTRLDSKKLTILKYFKIIACSVIITVSLSKLYQARLRRVQTLVGATAGLRLAQARTRYACSYNCLLLTTYYPLIQEVAMPVKFIAVCGMGYGASPEICALAEEIGRELANAGYGVVCGGKGGVMEAVCKGAKAAGGTTMGILPSYNRDEANPFVELVVCTGMGESRNTVVVATGEAVIAVGGEWGTLSEIALARKLGKKVVSLAGFGWELKRASPDDSFNIGILTAQSPNEAVKLAIG
jgi:uncharacterized protein (TIGR00725 family)